MQTYTLRAIQSMLGISRSVISGLIASGFVSPGRGKRREYRFSFQDVVLLRTAWSLQQAQIPSRKILRSLKQLKATLPGELPLSGLRISAVGNEVAVRHGATQWVPDSGQLLFDFEIRPGAKTVRFVASSDTPAATPAGSSSPLKPIQSVEPSPGTDEPVDWFDRAVALEPMDETAAEAAYRRAIAQAPDQADSYLNLGILLCDAGRADEAVALYRSGLLHCPGEPSLHFNLAIALEDLARPQEALARYERCLRLSPTFADAHYNAARLHEMLGHADKAIRHYNAYRRLQR